MTIKRNQRNRASGLTLLENLAPRSVPLAFFDPQYRELLDKMDYGNDKSKRVKLPQMSPNVIGEFIEALAVVIRPGGHLVCWMDKLGLLQFKHELPEFTCVDMITWEKPNWGQGYRSRRKSEFLVIYQKNPTRAKGVWMDHSIPDVWTVEREADELEGLGLGRRLSGEQHPHAKPIGLQSRIIKAVTKPRQLIVDPCAGGYSVLRACLATKRTFLGCDVLG